MLIVLKMNTTYLYSNSIAKAYDKPMQQAANDNAIELKVETDEALMCAYAEGDAAAFEPLYKRHKDALYRYMFRQLGNEAIVAEQFQEVWGKVIARREGYQAHKNQAKFKTWLYKIAHNQIVDCYRAQGRYREWQEAQVIDEPALETFQYDEPDKYHSRGQIAARVKSLIAALPPPQRDAFLLKEEAGLSLQEIADTVGVDRETIKSRLRYAVNKLRLELSKETIEA